MFRKKNFKNSISFVAAEAVEMCTGHDELSVDRA